MYHLPEKFIFMHFIYLREIFPWVSWRTSLKSESAGFDDSNRPILPFPLLLQNTIYTRKCLKLSMDLKNTYSLLIYVKRT